MQCTERGRVSNVNNTSACIIIVHQKLTDDVTSAVCLPLKRSFLPPPFWFGIPGISRSLYRTHSLSWSAFSAMMWDLPLSERKIKSKFDCWICYQNMPQTAKHNMSTTHWDVEGGYLLNLQNEFWWFPHFLHALQRVAQRKERMRLK